MNAAKKHALQTKKIKMEQYFFVLITLTSRIQDSGSFPLVCCHEAVQYLDVAVFCIFVLLVPTFGSLRRCTPSIQRVRGFSVESISSMNSHLS